MKYLAILLLFVGVACSQQSLTPSETAKIVVESFYNKDNDKLKKHTTAGNYEYYTFIQSMLVADNLGDSNFKVLQEKLDPDIAWVKFSTSYEDKPGLFKLIKEDGVWKVEELGVREKGPF